MLDELICPDDDKQPVIATSAPRRVFCDLAQNSIASDPLDKPQAAIEAAVSGDVCREGNLKDVGRLAFAKRHISARVEGRLRSRAGSTFVCIVAIGQAMEDRHDLRSQLFVGRQLQLPPGLFRLRAHVSPQPSPVYVFLDQVTAEEAKAVVYLRWSKCEADAAPSIGHRVVAGKMTGTDDDRCRFRAIA